MRLPFLMKNRYSMYSAMPISHIMTRRPETVSPKDNMEVVRGIFEKFGFHHVPVVDEKKLVGMVSYTDYLRVVRELFGTSSEAKANDKILNAMLVKEVMTQNVLSLNDTDTVESALRIFKTNHFHALPVVDSHGRLSGIVTTYDILKVLEKVFAEQSETSTEA